MTRVSLLSIVLVACTASSAPPAVIDAADAPMAVAAAVCSAEHGCDCPAPAWPDEETCVAAEIQALEDAAAIAADHALAYDGECVARRVQAYDAFACEPEVAIEPCALSCKAYVGGAAQGEACERLGITVAVDTCAQGLSCEAGVCVPSCEHEPPLPQGAACAAGIEPLGECEPELYCTPDTRRCAPRPVAGQPCPHDACAASSWCDRSAADGPTCVAQSSAGAACSVDTQCESERCIEGTCAALPAAACSFRAN